MDITGQNQENIETPTPNPDDEEKLPPISQKKPEEKERAKEEPVPKPEERPQNSAFSKNDPEFIKKKLEGDLELERDAQSRKDKDSQKSKKDSKKDLEKDSQSKKDSKKVAKNENITPTPQQEEDKLPLMKEEVPVNQGKGPQQEEKVEKVEKKENLEVKESQASGNNLGISLRIPEKEKKSKEESKKILYKTKIRL